MSKSKREAEQAKREGIRLKWGENAFLEVCSCTPSASISRSPSFLRFHIYSLEERIYYRLVMTLAGCV
jgi:hypothetical protein